MVIGTCGHEIIDGIGHMVAVKEYARDGDRCISHKSVCKECADWYAERGLVANEAEQQSWLKYDHVGPRAWNAEPTLAGTSELEAKLS